MIKMIKAITRFFTRRTRQNAFLAAYEYVVNQEGTAPIEMMEDLS